MQRLLFVVLFVICPLCVSTAAQTRVNELSGFRLKQYRETTHNEYGEPDISDKAESGIEHEVFFRSEEPLLYVVFQYQPHLRSLIWSIQISGNDTKVDPGFLGLRFGMTETDIEKRLGKATRKVDAGEHGTRLHFGNANYSIEINSEGKLSSIRIFDDDENATSPDLKKIPQAADVIKTLTSGPNSKIAEITAPDMETYVDGKIGYFGLSFKNEIVNDNSKIFSTLKELSKELIKVDLKKAEEYEENMRLRLGSDPMHVVKFKKTARVRELVFKWDGFKWLLWEFDAGRPKDEQESVAGYPKRTFSELVTTKAEELEKDPDHVFYGPGKKPVFTMSYNPTNSEIAATFTGEIRKTTKSHKELITHFLQTTGSSKELADLYDNEVKFVENGKEYWVTADMDVLQKLTETAKKGDKVNIFISWLGFAHVSGERENVFILQRSVLNLD